MSSSTSFLRFLALSLISISTFVSCHNTFSFYIPKYGTECFVEVLSNADRMDWNYEIMSPPDRDLDVFMMNPDGTVLKSINNEIMGNFGFNADVGGKYKICFVNSKSSNEKLIYFTLTGPDEYHKLSKDAQISEDSDGQFLKSLQDLSNELRIMRDEQAMLNARATRHMQTIQSTNSRVFWWTFFQGGLLLAVVGFQVYYIQSFFNSSSKRLV